MRRNRRLVKLLSIITLAVFIFSNILTTVWAGVTGNINITFN